MDNISIVLVEPRGSGNIGSVARAMKNTGFSRLVLINPVDYKNNEAYSMACKATDILLNSEVFNNFNEALKGSYLAVGTTRRKGRERFPLLTLKESIPKIVASAKYNQVSIIFGREDKGLKTEEISKCDIILEIPTHPLSSSINLSHAVFIVCHNILTAFTPEEPSFRLAPRDEVERMHTHIEETLKELGYGEKGGEYLLRNIMRNFRRLFGRTGLMQKEVNMIRGICTQIKNSIK